MKHPKSAENSQNDSVFKTSRGILFWFGDRYGLLGGEFYLDGSGLGDWVHIFFPGIIIFDQY